MKYIELFEHNREQLSENEIMGKLLHIYGSIPVPKQKSNEVIKKILWDNFIKLGNRDSPFYKLGKNIDLTYQAEQDKVRFVDYFDSLLTNKEIRGHNFEGFIAAVFNGELAKKLDSRYDVTINDKTWSIKFINDYNESPEIGSFKDSLENNYLYDNTHLDLFNLKNLVIAEGGLVNMFQKGSDKDVRKALWDKIISQDITGGWLIAYPIKNNSEIIVNIVSPLVMKKMLYSGYANIPKSGFENLFSLRLSSKYRNFPGVKHFSIKIPKLSLDELKKIYTTEEEENWGQEIFGKYGNKIRPDVLRYMKDNQQDIASKLLKFNNFK